LHCPTIGGGYSIRRAVWPARLQAGAIAKWAVQADPRRQVVRAAVRESLPRLAAPTAPTAVRPAQALRQEQPQTMPLKPAAAPA